MAPSACNICLEEFTEKLRIPKIMECGHTFCSLCLIKLLRAQKVCPNCKAKLGKSVEEYPTNYIVFESAIKEMSLCPSPHFLCTLKQIEAKLMIRKEIVRSRIAERISLQKMIAKDLERTRHVLDLDEDIKNDSHPENLIVEIEAHLISIDDILNCCDVKTPIRSTYDIACYRNTSSFLYDLANRLHNGEEIYAFLNVENSTTKYGRIVLNENNRLDVHVLDLSGVGKTAALVSFQDLRKCVTKDNFRTFINIGDHTMSFEIIDSSFLATRFIKLCSGETGASLKDTSFKSNCFTPADRKTRSEFLSIEKCNQDILLAEGANDYNLSMSSTEKERDCPINELVVQMIPEGPCKIHKCIYLVDIKLKNIVAKGTDPFTGRLYGINPDVITDSGISFLID